MNINNFHGVENDGVKFIIDSGEGMVLFLILFLERL